MVLPEVADPQNNNTLTHPEYEYRYDAWGNQVSIRDPLGHETRFTYDEQGRETSRTLPIGVSTPDAVDDDDFVEHKYYDAYGRLHYEVSFEGVVTAYVYDDRPGASGRLSEKRFFANEGAYSGGAGSPDEVVQYTYDAFGRQVNVLQDADGDTTATTNDQRATVTTYDTQGQVLSVATPEGVIHYEYDRVTGLHKRTWTAPTTATTAENATTDTYYLYDTLGRLDEVRQTRRNGQTVDADPNREGNQPEATDYVYDLLGNLKQTRLPNKVVSDYTYDELNRLTLLREFKDGQDSQEPYAYEDLVDTLLAQYDYDLAPDGKRTGVTEKTRVDSVLQETRIDWLYDDLGRLTRESYNSASDDSLDFIADYTFDLVGNRRTKKTDTDPTFSGDPTYDEQVTYEYDANDRLLTEAKDAAGTANDTTTRYEYGPNADLANGYGGDWTQQTKKTVFDALDSPLSSLDYSYNLQGRMAQANVDSDGNGDLEERYEFTYDASGIRVTQTVTKDTDSDGSLADETPVETKYLNDVNNPTGYSQVLEERVSGSVTKTYTLALDVVAQQGPAIAGGGNLFLLYDGHGSTRGLVDANGEPLSGQVFRYDAFGNLLDSATALTSLLYSGEQTDGTGLQYLRARYYDPNSGRFNRLDPWAGNVNDPQSLHKYLFVRGDPANRIDPTGLMDLVSLGFTTTWSANPRLQSAAANIKALKDVSSTLKMVSQAYSKVSKVWDWVNAAREALSILDFDPRELLRLKDVICNKLGTSAGAAIPTGIHAKFRISLPGGLINKLRNVLRGTTENNYVQSWIGTLGGVLLAKALGFESTTIGSAYHGIDAVLKDPILGRFAILEAKGGSSTLSGGQMHDPWIQSRLDKIAKENRGTADFHDFDAAVRGSKVKPVPVARMWAIVVKLDIRAGRNDFWVAVQEYPGVKSWGSPLE